MEMADQITLNTTEWSNFIKNLTAPSTDYSQSLYNYFQRIAQAVVIEERGQESIIRSDRIDFEGLFAILDGECIEKHTIEDSLSTVVETEWMPNETRTSRLIGSLTAKNNCYFSGSANNLAAA